jgi:DNA-binding transcriptional MerR regulator
MILVKIDEVAKTIGISVSAIKKYYLLIEEFGYRFKRNQQGQLLFNDKDIELFQKLIRVKNQPGVKLREAVELVISSITDLTVITDEDITKPTNITDITPIAEGIKSLTELVKQQHELVKNQQHQINLLIKGQQENQKLLESSVSNRDELLMQNLRETQELKKLILEESKKKWWKKIF